MRTTDAMPPKSATLRCAACGLTSGWPIIVTTSHGPRCSNAIACEKRRGRAKAKRAVVCAEPRCRHLRSEHSDDRSPACAASGCRCQGFVSPDPEARR